MYQQGKDILQHVIIMSQYGIVTDIFVGFNLGNKKYSYRFYDSEIAQIIEICSYGRQRPFPYVVNTRVLMAQIHEELLHQQSWLD